MGQPSSAIKEISERHRIIIEPLDPAVHDRAEFSCGVSRLDNFLKRTARKQRKGDFTRVWVAVEPRQRTILGYYAMNAHSLEAEEDMPRSIIRHAPRSGSIPAVYLSMMAVDERHQGRGLGRILLADALSRAAKAADQIGLKIVVLDAIDDGGPQTTERRKAFYRTMGFQPFPSQPSRMFIATDTVRAAEHRP